MMGESGDLWQVRLAPDDHTAVTVTAPLLRTLDITIVPSASGAPSQPLTLALAADSDPVWSPDGRRVLFKSLQTGRPALFVKRAHDKDADDEAFVGGEATPTDWRDANVIAHAAAASSGYDVVAIDEARHTRDHRKERLQRYRWPLVAGWEMDRVCVGRIGTAGYLRQSSEALALASRLPVAQTAMEPRWSLDLPQGIDDHARDAHPWRDFRYSRTGIRCSRHPRLRCRPSARRAARHCCRIAVVRFP